MSHNIPKNCDVHGSTRLVVGANGGIGLALVKAQLARPDVSKVIATHRATALNQFIKTMAIECRGKYPRAAIVAIHPGTTDTGLSRPFQNNVSAGKLYTTEQTAGRLLNVLEEINEKQSGQFLNWNGTTIPW